MEDLVLLLKAVVKWGCDKGDERIAVGGCGNGLRRSTCCWNVCEVSVGGIADVVTVWERVVGGENGSCFRVLGRVYSDMEGRSGQSPP